MTASGGRAGRRRAAAVAVVLVPLTVLAYLATLGWDQRKELGADGYLHGPYEAWQGFALAAVAVAAGLAVPDRRRGICRARSSTLPGPDQPGSGGCGGRAWITARSASPTWTCIVHSVAASHAAPRTSRRRQAAPGEATASARESLTPRRMSPGG